MWGLISPGTTATARSLAVQCMNDWAEDVVIIVAVAATIAAISSSARSENFSETCVYALVGIVTAAATILLLGTL
jgi:hypothetical protein